MREPNSVAVYENGPSVRDRSNEALTPHSASIGRRTTSRDSPAASVSSVIGVGPKKPVPTDHRLVQWPARASAETRGRRMCRDSLWTSSRALEEIASAGVTLRSVLREHARHGERVVKPGNIPRRVGVAFDRQANMLHGTIVVQ